MTVSTTKASDVFPGNGSSGPFSCEWRIFDDTDVIVSRVDQTTGADTPMVLNTDYTISGAGDQAGFTVATVSPVASGTSLYVRRSIAYTQPTDFTNQGAFFPTMHEDAMDRLEMQIQQQTDDLARTLKSNAVTGNFEVGSSRITGVADAVDAGDTPNLAQTQQLVTGAASGIVPSLIATLTDLASTSAGKGAALLGYIHSLAGSVARTVLARLRSEVYASDFGTKGDGVTDDTTALQAAISACQNATGDGRVLVLDDGNYLITSGLTSTGTFSFRARGKLGAKITTNNAITMFTGDVSKINGIVFVHNGSSGSCVALTGDKALVADSYCSVSASNTSPAIYLTGSNQQVMDCGFTSRNASAFCIKVSYNGQSCINGRISGCTMYGSGKGIVFSQDVTGGRPEGWSVDGNKIILSGQQPIRIDTVLHLSITGNIIDQSSGYGVHFTPISNGADGVIIGDNYIATAQSTSTGIGVGSTAGTGGIRGVVVRHNFFNYCGYGVYFDSQFSQSSAVDNYFDNITANSITCNAAPYIGVTGNIFRGSNVHLSLGDGASGGPYTIANNIFPSTGSISYTATDPSKFYFSGNIGKKFSGYCTGVANVTSGTNAFLNVPHGLAAAPDAAKVVLSISRAGGALNNPCAIVSSIDSTNIVVNLFWSGIVTAGNIRVNAWASM